MYMMNYDQFMNRPLTLKTRIEHKVDDVQFKWNVCQNTTATISERVQTSPANTQETSYLRYISAKKELDELCIEYDKVCDGVRAFLYDELEPDEASILEWRYVQGKSAQEISAITGVTYDAARARLSRAGKKASRIFKSSQMSQHDR